MSTPRHQAREAALRSLYFWEIGQTDPAQALETYFEIHQPDAPEPVREFARALVLGTAADVASLDVLIQQHSEHWRLGRLAVIDRLILRLGAWELQHAGDTPHAVILNEALELARTFSTDEAVRFVNGVLDSIRKSLAV
jgi:N utilization substance protein B